MALLYIDSFDHYTTITDKGWTGASVSLSIGTSGRFGSRIYQNGDNRGGAYRAVSVSGDTIIIGFALRLDSFASTQVPFLGIANSGVPQVHFTITTGGAIQCRRSATGDMTNSGTQLGISNTSVISLDVWYYFEAKVKVHDSTGTVDVRLNGVDLTGLTGLTGLDTSYDGTSTINRIYLGGFTTNDSRPSGCHDWDDLYVCDTSGSAPTNTFLGDIRVEALFPTGNGNSSQLVGSDSNSTDNYLLVDEAAPATADYVESSTVGDKDTYAFGNLTSTTGTVYGVQVLPYAAKTDAGTRSIVSVARLSSTEVDSSDKILSTTAQYLPDIREAKPGTGVWTISDVNSAEFGVKVTA